MAKARAIVKRRKAVRNIRKITKTMQMIATVKFQKALKRAVGTKPFTRKVRELTGDLAKSVENIQHPLMRQPQGGELARRIAVLVLTSDRGLAGAYNGSLLRLSSHFLREQEAAGNQIELYVAGKKGISYFNFQKRPMAGRFEDLSDAPVFTNVEKFADTLIGQFTECKLDAVYAVYMNFVSTGVQKPQVLTLLPMTGVNETADHPGQSTAKKADQSQAGALDSKRGGAEARAAELLTPELVYEFSPSAPELLDLMLPMAVKTALFQCCLDAVSSENVARMVAMKSATDNADKVVKVLSMQYNRARQSQITTELSEIMGGVEAMKK